MTLTFRFISKSDTLLIVYWENKNYFNYLCFEFLYQTYVGYIQKIKSKHRYRRWIKLTKNNDIVCIVRYLLCTILTLFSF